LIQYKDTLHRNKPNDQYVSKEEAEHKNKIELVEFDKEVPSLICSVLITTSFHPFLEDFVLFIGVQDY
jgi:hypothetical protein